jgi:pyridoxamine 5'-phosphate oxidase
VRRRWKVGDLRRDYAGRGLAETQLAGTWWEQFDRWFGELVDAQVLLEPNAVVLATAGPSVRTVLLKGYDERGFVFYTNRLSRKGSELAERPAAGLCFSWVPLGRQVCVAGSVEEVSEQDSDAYFASRPRGAQLGAWASRQSAVIASRSVLEEAAAAVDARFPGEVPRPAYWGGYRVVPTEVEFWQGREDRLHDRLRFRLTGGGAWVVERLSP